DGDLDLYVANDDRDALFRNEGNGNAMLIVKTVGTTSNRSGIGARVRVVCGSPSVSSALVQSLSQIREVSGGSNYAAQNSLPVEFGLGAGTLVDSVIVRWPGGIVQVLTDVGVDQYITVTEPSGDIVPPAVPQNLVATPGDGEAILTWSLNTEPDLSHYIIYRSQTQGFTPTTSDSVGAVEKPNTTFTDIGLTNRATYYYRISAVDNAGNESTFSEEVQAVPDETVLPQPDIALSATSYNFGEVQVGTSSTWTLVVSNTGESALSVSSISSGDAQFTASPTSFTVAAGESEDVTVTFAPTSSGNQIATFTITSNDPDEGSLQVSLNGNGSLLPPNLSLSATGYNFGEVQVGTSSTWTLVVSNT
ncbi:MAG: choice-of-anchor D domain-containing protein, partial [Candidatus Latescibacteria bacterium]|nr:choice-of-anchor D domain-containing protein [Candidatus Latescibacterota bacterium]